MRHARALALYALGVASAGCSFGPVHGYAPDEGVEFTSTDLEIIRRELGSLPAKPPQDSTNLYADDRDAAVLGQQFFFEKRYSKNGDISCATCHDPETGFQDHRANTSQGVTFTARHTPTVFNVGFGPGRAGSTVWLTWDGKKDSLWSQALASPESPVDMGGTRMKVALLIYDKYRQPYTALFGDMPALRDDQGNPVASPTAIPLKPGGMATADTMAWDALSDPLKDGITRVYVNFGKAIAAYERLVVSRSSRFDTFYEEIDGGATHSKVLDAEEARGLKVFIGNGKCISCHLGPNFSDWKFHNIGIDQLGDNVPMVDEGRAAGLPKVVADGTNCAGAYSDRTDKAGCAVNGIVLDDSTLVPAQGAFKTPTLRNVSLTAPYFHTGAEPSLADVVDHYDQGGDQNGAFTGTVDANVQRLGLTEEEKADVVKFLQTLEGVALPSSLGTAPALPD